MDGTTVVVVLRKEGRKSPKKKDICVGVGGTDEGVVANP